MNIFVCFKVVIIQVIYLLGYIRYNCSSQADFASYNSDYNVCQSYSGVVFELLISVVLKMELGAWALRQQARKASTTEVHSPPT